MPVNWSSKETPIVRRALKQIKAEWEGTPEAQALIDAVAFEWGIDLELRTERDPINPNRARRVQLRGQRKRTAEQLAAFKAERERLNGQK